MIKLEDLYGPAFARLANEEWAKFSPADFPPPPRVITADNLVVRRIRRNIGGYQHEQVCFLAHKSTFRRLALVLIAGLFHDPREDLPIRIELAHPAAELPTLFVDNNDLSFIRVQDFTGRVGLDYFDYEYTKLDRYPWHRNLPADVEDLPRFTFTDQADGNGDVGLGPALGVVIAGRRTGQARLIELLLTLSDARNEGLEFELEAEDGFRGVAPASIEAQFLLPGCPAWDVWAQGM